ncbi:MAG: HEAT repeat domain-containing protein [Planctomycetota bacterium]
MPQLRPWLMTPLLAAAACAPSPLAGGFEEPSPPARLYAMTEVARSRDDSAIPQLVEQLDSDDAAVRWVAIRTLEHLTNETLGYRFDDPPAARRAATERWVRAVERGTFATVAAAPAPVEATP